MPTNKNLASIFFMKINDEMLLAQIYIITLAELFLLDVPVGNIIHIGLSSESILKAFL